MAYSYSEHPSVGVGQTLPLGFLYEPTSTVRVLVDGVPVPESLYFWSSNTEITTLTGFPAGAVTKVERFTPIDEYNAQNGTSVYDFEGVNLNFQQLLYALQESRDNEDLRQQQIDDIEDTAEALALGLAQVDQIKADVEGLAQAASDSAAQAATFDPANFYTKGQADARYFTQSQVNTFLSTKADNIIEVTGGGLATGGGSLVAPRVITVTKSTDAESKARTRDDVAVTPRGAGLAAIEVAGFEQIGNLIDLGGQTSLIWTNLSAYRELFLDLCCLGSVNTYSVQGHVSTDNGSTWITGASDYSASRISQSAATVSGAAANFGHLVFNYANSITTTGSLFTGATMRLRNFNKAARMFGKTDIGYFDTSGNLNEINTVWTTGLLARNALRLQLSTGNFASGYAVLWGLKG